MHSAAGAGYIDFSLHHVARFYQVLSIIWVDSAADSFTEPLHADAFLVESVSNFVFAPEIH